MLAPAWMSLQLLAQQPGAWRLRSPALRVFFFAAADLDGREFRPIKQQRVARALGVRQQDISKALLALVAEGYLEVGPSDGQSKTYRLNMVHNAVQCLMAS